MSTITLFNKNHITLTKIEYAKKFLTNKITVENRITHTSLGQSTSKKQKFESKLGFYYYKDIFEYIPAISNNLTIVELYVNNNLYTLTYYTKYNNVSIGVETRPWNLVISDKSLEDHYILDLLNELNNIFSIAEYNKTITNVKGQSVNEVKRIIFTDIFGFPDGPKYQTNEEKILSHGFDLKTSFRKDKENG